MPQPNTSWPEEHRPVLFVVLAITIIMFVLGGAQVLHSIRAPFAPRVRTYSSAEEAQEKEVAAQKARDTDNDALSDYDELHIYITSPYISDTDSDGVLDGAEVQAGEDPNCPAGKNCGPAETLVGPGTQPTDFALNPGSGAVVDSQQSTFIGLTPDTIQNMTPTQVRELLRGSGVSEDVLAQFSDEALMQLFNQTLATNNPASSTPPTR